MAMAMAARAERRLSPRDNRAEGPKTITDAHTRSLPLGKPTGSRHSTEVDAVSNPTELFRRINSGDWEAALQVAQRNPSDASVWISRRSGDDEAFTSWKYLPLHLTCLQRRPPLELIRALLQFYPQAARVPAPHDGNLAIHYVCESGCEDERVFGALLAEFPKGLEIQNANNKTPLLMCHSKSRSILMKILRQRKPLPSRCRQHLTNPVQLAPEAEGARSKRDKKPKRNVDRRNDTATYWKGPPSNRETQPASHRCPPQTTSARCSAHRRPSFAETNELPNGREPASPRVSNHRSANKIRSAPKKEPSSSFFEHPHSFFAPSSSSSDGIDGSTSNYISSKTTELALSALNYLYPSYQEDLEAEREEGKGDMEDNLLLRERVRSLIEENAAQKRTIEELTKNLHDLTTPNRTKGDNTKLCERILAKAEADNVAFRTQIQQLQSDRDLERNNGKLQEKKWCESFARVRKVICDKGSEMNIDIFGDQSTCTSNSSDHGDQITEALERMLSHMDERNNNLHSTISGLEGELSDAAVALKTAHAKKDLLERKTIVSEEEKQTAQARLEKEQDRTSTLVVINQSLQDQVESLTSNAQHTRTKVDQDSAVISQFDHQHVVEMEEQMKCLVEKNRSLKETLLSSNEKYSKKMQELAEKYSSLEKANEELRMSLTKVSSCGGSQSDMRVNLEGEKRLLYEV